MNEHAVLLPLPLMPAHEKAPRFLVIRRRYLGDIVLLGSVFASLKRHRPGCHVALLAEPKFAPVAQMDPCVDAVIALPGSPVGWPALFSSLRRGRFTHVLDFDNRAKTALLGLASGAKVRATLRHGAAPRIARLYTRTAFVESDYFERQHHIVDFYHQLLGALSIPVSPIPPRLNTLLDDAIFVRELPEFEKVGANQRAIFIHPGSRSPHRVWPAERFAAVIKQLRERNIACILVAGPGEQAVVRAIQSHLEPSTIEISRPLTIPQLAALFQCGDVLLCHDSGPMHLAAAVGTRVVALFSSQNVATWRPLGDGHITLQAPMPCKPCLSPDFCVPSDSYRNHCVRHLTVEQVVAAVLRQLGDSPSVRG